VQAVSIAPGLLASPMVDRWYSRVDPSLEQTSNLPVIVLENFGAGLPPQLAFQLNAMSLYDIDASTGRSSLLGEPDVESRVGLKVRGSTTSAQAKRPYALEIWDEQNDDAPLPLLGMLSDADWVLYPPYQHDRAMVRTTMLFELSNQMGRYASRSRFVEVYHNMDGGDLTAEDYRGIYVLMERIERGAGRVDVTELGRQDNTEPEVSGGWILKLDREDPGDVGFQAARHTILYVDPKESDVTAQQAAWIQDYFNAMFESLSDPNPETGYAQWIDVDSWIDYHILTVLPKNVDALRLSTYFFKDRGGLIEMGPLWDMNQTMDSADFRDDDPDTWDAALHGTKYFQDERSPWWGLLFSDPDFMQKWIDRWTQLRQGPLSTDHVMDVIDRQTAELAEAQERNFSRWPEVAPRTTSPFASGKLDGTWQGEVEHLKEWLRQRLNWIDRQFVPSPAFAPAADYLPAGQPIEMNADAPKIYFTLDGSDPRLPGGEVDPSAIEYAPGTPYPSSGVAPLVIRARALEDGRWSGLGSAEYGVAPPGDLNLDGAVSSADIEAFALALRDSEVYALLTGVSAALAGDSDGDGDLDYDDIGSFVSRVHATESAPPRATSLEISKESRRTRKQAG
jgi:hypothetical protein